MLKLQEKNTDAEFLAQFRTLLALERNYLAEERTLLAKFRTGLALILISPPLYLYSIALNINFNLYIFFLFYGFLILCAAWGSWMILQTRIDLKKNRKLKKAVMEREKDIINCSKIVHKLFAEFMA